MVSQKKKTPPPDAGGSARSRRNHPAYFPENEFVMCLQGVPAPVFVGTLRNVRRALRGHICSQPPPAGQPAGSPADEFRSRCTPGSPYPLCTNSPRFGLTFGALTESYLVSMSSPVPQKRLAPEPFTWKTARAPGDGDRAAPAPGHRRGAGPEPGASLASPSTRLSVLLSFCSSA